ncbi:acyl transferase 4 [Cajanus cajan]|uniref:3'-N-debenzoyl-2'-deoxytaxol N-benzoyltransferase n=1 Tax=Cajanus cajan TaxID=3821 RepID=A0A151TXI7_CAJCA|nr:acyl transferase 4 [Cajanus cajan]KYP71728.1 3'-N-debenzoyl-2'-deoxytaxol N-benzoyltransferase [Cajanus cajan]
MALSVIRRKEGLVKPAEETPLTTLDLSAIDKLGVLRCNVRTLHVFKHGPQAARVIREALSKALVPYYPLAGRLIEPKPGCLQIQCSAHGVWLVEASSHSTLHSLNYFDNLHSIPYDDLLPESESQCIQPLVQMQVTEFGCGGFVMGLIFCHSICDGLGAAQFLNAIGELARGLDKPSVEPVWQRDFFPSQQIALPPNPIPPMAEYKLEHANIDMPMDQIKGVKREFEQATGRTCSAFEVVAAACWASRTRAIQFRPNTQLKLVFFANCRNLVEPPLPNGFYGNCFFPVSISASCESLTNASMVDVVKLIKEAKGKVGAEFGKYLKGEQLEEPFAPPLTYTTLFVSEWGRLGFNHVDYRWGPPVHVVPIQGSAVIPVAIVGSLPLPNKGIRLMTWCVEDPHRTPFLHHIHIHMACMNV